MQATDQTPPTMPPTSLPTIARGYAPSGCSGSGSTCADIGIVSILPKAMDDMTPPEKIGFRITLAGGALPDGFTLPTDTIDLAPNSPALQFIWVDGATDHQDAIDFTLSIVAVDLAGNESAPQTVVVKDSGAGSGGCSLSSGRASAPIAIGLALLVLLVAGRQRRRK